MVDVHEPNVRSYNMRQIKGKNTKPELIVRKFLHRSGLRYGLHNKSLLGKPDLVLRKYKTIVFVHGCFWHSHAGCKLNRPPKSRKDYWEPKLKKNTERDKIHENNLISLGWKVIKVWECEVMDKKKRDARLELLLKEIISENKDLERTKAINE